MVNPGQQKFSDENVVPHTLGSDAAVAGDAVTISQNSGELVLCDGTNGFFGILRTQTAAGSQDSDVTAGDEVAVAVGGQVPGNVADTVGAGDRLVTSGTTGELAGEDADGDTSNDPAGPSDLTAITAADADGFGLVDLG